MTLTVIAAVLPPLDFEHRRGCSGGALTLSQDNVFLVCQSCRARLAYGPAAEGRPKPRDYQPNEIGHRSSCAVRGVPSGQRCENCHELVQIEGQPSGGESAARDTATVTTGTEPAAEDPAKLADAYLIGAEEQDRAIESTPGRRVLFQQGHVRLTDERDVAALMRRPDVRIAISDGWSGRIDDWVVLATANGFRIEAQVEVLGCRVIEDADRKFRVEKIGPAAEPWTPPPTGPQVATTPRRANRHAEGCKCGVCKRMQGRSADKEPGGDH